MTKRKALGSGLDSLLSSARRVTESETSDQPQTIIFTGAQDSEKQAPTKKSIP